MCGNASCVGNGVKAIREDAANDVVMNSGAFLCAVPELWLPYCHRWVNGSVATCLLLRMDPSWALLVSFPILHGWYETARTSAESLHLYSRGLPCIDYCGNCCLRFGQKLAPVIMQRFFFWAKSLVGWQLPRSE